MVKTVEINTTGEPAAIRLTADRNVIKASRRDVAHITVEVVDAEGRMVPTAENEIAFALDGPGRILALIMDVLTATRVSRETVAERSTGWRWCYSNRLERRGHSASQLPRRHWLRMRLPLHLMRSKSAVELGRIVKGKDP